jgi:hypothetical protein
MPACNRAFLIPTQLLHELFRAYWLVAIVTFAHFCPSSKSIRYIKKDYD